MPVEAAETVLLWPARWRWLARVSAFVAVAALLALALLFALDQFQVRVVWATSHADLPLLYKLANLWGDDGATLLLLTALSALAATRLCRYPGWAGPGALLMVAAFAVGAMLWSPFAPSPPDAGGVGQGMNVHLVRVWMLLHPPLVLLAFVIFLAPVGAAAEALARGSGAWREIAGRWARCGWLLLSLGLASGMWWAYEDFTFGQFWHWDPVQTAVFVVWALATAHLHTLRRYRLDGAYARLHPLLGLLTALAALVALVVTRHPALASSHRYVGETSWFWLTAMALALAVVIVVALARAPTPSRAPRRTEAGVLITIATLALGVCALVGAGVLVEASLAQSLAWPRPDKFKPFFEFLARWTSEAEVAELQRQFEQWDVDRYLANALLALVGIVIGLVGGHNFLPWRRWRWPLSLAVVLCALIVVLAWQPLDAFYTGKGMTSANTSAIFPLLDALVVAMLYLGLSSLVWGLDAALRHGRRRALWRYHLPVGAVHLGVVVALLSAIVASVFDLDTWRNLRFPDELAAPVSFPWGYEVTVTANREAFVDDGSRSSFQAVAEVRWSQIINGETVAGALGTARYRDRQPQPPQGLGPVRLMCEIIDYRYARTLSGASQMIDPYIHRGLWRDVQIWLPAVEYRREEGNLENLRAPTTLPLVVKIFPMMTWLWLGLLLALAGAIAAMRHEFKRV